jgi:2-C-methyl-D-erythritol 2,4-cyclodiphosphate synthase
MKSKNNIQEKKQKTTIIRFGLGYDVHRLVEGRKLILGGVRIPSETGLHGHSDADVLLHAICDALLGAAAMGDIGNHFPDTDETYRGVSSLKLLNHVNILLQKQGYKIGNIDSTIILEHPKIAKYVDLMCQRIARVLHISPRQVSVKATTHEGLGAFGRGEGCAAYAIASIVDSGRM